jgi:hypothetical protein
MSESVNLQDRLEQSVTSVFSAFILKERRRPIVKVNQQITKKIQEAAKSAEAQPQSLLEKMLGWALGVACGILTAGLTRSPLVRIASRVLLKRLARTLR